MSKLFTSFEFYVDKKITDNRAVTIEAEYIDGKLWELEITTTGRKHNKNEISWIVSIQITKTDSGKYNVGYFYDINNNFKHGGVLRDDIELFLKRLRDYLKIPIYSKIKIIPTEEKTT